MPQLNDAGPVALLLGAVAALIFALAHALPKLLAQRRTNDRTQNAGPSTAVLTERIDNLTATLEKDLARLREDLTHVRAELFKDFTALETVVLENRRTVESLSGRLDALAKDVAFAMHRLAERP
jgi:uncharacterized protein YaaN involved in tellurite resistance